jgi:hypothetical protein
MLLQNSLSKKQRRILYNIRDAAQINVWSKPKDKDYADNTPYGHSERVIILLGQLCDELQKTKNRLNRKEIFIILAAAYLHDIGMQYKGSQNLSLEERRQKHNKLSAKMIRGSLRYRSKYPDLGLTEVPEYIEEIAQLSLNHTLDNFKGVPDIVLKGHDEVRLHLLVALLGFADELDTTYERVNIEELKIHPVATSSRIFWYIRHYVEGLTAFRGQVKIEYKVPNQKYIKPVTLLVSKRLEEVSQKVKSTLSTYNLSIVIVQCEKCTTSRVKYPMDKDDFCLAKAEYLRKLDSPIKETIIKPACMEYVDDILSCDWAYYDEPNRYSREMLVGYLQRYSEGFRVLQENSTSLILGYSAFFPIEKKLFDSLLCKELTKVKDVRPEYTLCGTRKTKCDYYLDDIVIMNACTACRPWEAVKLVKQMEFDVVDLIKKGKASRIGALVVTREGKRLLEMYSKRYGIRRIWKTKDKGRTFGNEFWLSIPEMK